MMTTVKTWLDMRNEVKNFAPGISYEEANKVAALLLVAETLDNVRGQIQLLAKDVQRLKV